MQHVCICSFFRSRHITLIAWECGLLLQMEWCGLLSFCVSVGDEWEPGKNVRTNHDAAWMWTREGLRNIFYGDLDPHLHRKGHFWGGHSDSGTCSVVDILNVTDKGAAQGNVACLPSLPWQLVLLPIGLLLFYGQFFRSSWASSALDPPYLLFWKRTFGNQNSDMSKK